MTDRPTRLASAAYCLALLAAAVAGSGPRTSERSGSPLDCPHGWIETAAVGSATSEVGCATEAGTGPPVRGPARLLVGLPIELNRASVATLEVLPGIGPERAAAIQRARCQEPFTGLPDVQRVRGIGPRTAAGLCGWAVAGPAETDRCETSTTLPP